MTTAPQPKPAEMTCTVCGTPVASDALRCPSCGLSRPARGSRVLGRHGLWLLGGMLLAVYLIVLSIVAAAR